MPRQLPHALSRALLCRGSFALTLGSEAKIVGEEEVTFLLGLDGVRRISPGESGLPAAAEGW